MENIRFLLNKIEIYVTFCYIVQKNGKKKEHSSTAKGKLFNVAKKKIGEIHANILDNFSMNQNTRK